MVNYIHNMLMYISYLGLYNNNIITKLSPIIGDVSRFSLMVRSTLVAFFGPPLLLPPLFPHQPP